MSAPTDSATAPPPARMAHTPDPPPTAPAADEALAAPRRGFLAAGWAKFSDNIVPGVAVAVMAGLVLFFFNEVSDQITETNDRITRLDTEHDARFIRLEENQQEMAVTLAALIAEFSAFREDVDARFTAVEARLTRLEENQREMAVTLARLVALFEAHFEVPAIASG